MIIQAFNQPAAASRYRPQSAASPSGATDPTESLQIQVGAPVGLTGGQEMSTAPFVAEVGLVTALHAGAPAAGLPGAVLASMIDHTLLKPDATASQIKTLCAEARQHKFASVCVQPGRVALAARELQGSGVMVCTVVGFPHGATSPEGTAAETRQALKDGADEIDMVINVGKLKDRDDAAVQRDIEAVVEAAGGHTVKVILETSLLTDEEKVRACQLSVAAGADFVKTSTGFAGGGATVEDIALMRRTVGPELGVKASGGVRDNQTANLMIQAGATRIGASSSVAIVQGAVVQGGGN